MDPHFNEYIAAIAGMHEVYGERPEDFHSDFHDEHACVVVQEPAAVT